MLNKFKRTAGLSFAFLATLLGSISLTSCNETETEQDMPDVPEMKESKKEFDGYIQDLSTFPISFMYGDRYFKGFGPDFEVIRNEVKTVGIKETHYIDFALEDTIRVYLEASYYDGYDAFDYTVKFKNYTDKNSKVFQNMHGIDYNLKGKNAHLKSSMGDHEYKYEEYDYDLSQKSVNFRSDLGRATHIYFPYFNLETDDGGALLALGWAGTWEADFVYDANKETTNYKGQGVIDFKSYLKPGETIRTPLNAVVRYYEKDQTKAFNKWRRWYVDCNMPKENKLGETFKPKKCAVLWMDTGRPNSDGSISEGYDSWKPSLDKIYGEGIKLDVRWFDAGWYEAPDGGSPVTDWWGTVGTWKLDPKKWPGTSFKDSVEYAKEHGTQTMVWFESERVTHPKTMAKRHGFDLDWVLSDYGTNNYFLANLGDEDCYRYITDKIITMLDENDVDIYREDFNMDPQILFTVKDGYEGLNRVGITENKYYQNHYRMWDEIIEYTSSKGGASYVDSCASGGGRNDLESMRRGIPFIRSDSDRTSIDLRLAMTTRLSKWLPAQGGFAKESANELTAGTFDDYVLRATYLPITTYDYTFQALSADDYATLRKSQSEYDIVKNYFFNDFYQLTPARGTFDSSNWTAYEYFDGEKQEGIVQAFRQATCEEETLNLKIQGLDENKFYKLTDFDGTQSISRVSGKMLMDGIEISLPQRGSLVYKIEAID